MRLINRRLIALMAVPLMALLGACDSGSGGDSAAPPDPTPPPGPNISLSGQVSYDFVPAVPAIQEGYESATLDYDQTQAKPVRGVLVKAVDSAGDTLATATTDAQGGFSLSVPKNTQVRLRAISQIVQTGQPSWDFAVRDNTSAGFVDNQAAFYALEGPAFDSGETPQTHNLHAASGWAGQDGYGQRVRAAAPFAILDQVYTAIEKIRSVDPDVQLHPLNIYWSPENQPAEGDVALGEIGTSHFNHMSDQPGLYILGKADVDTDEYDTGVIVHEWGHYLENYASRSDSIGGSHTSGDRLNMTVAFGEGFGNALAGIVRDDPLYVDTSGPRQSIGMVLDLDTLDTADAGWFSEDAIQYTLYQWYKSPSIGLAPIYGALVGPQKTTPALTSLFSFATYLRASAPADAQALIDQSLQAIQVISGNALDIWGTHQYYPDNLRPDMRDIILPIYRDLNPGAPIGFCLSETYGEYNKLGNRALLRIRIPQAGTYRLTIQTEDESTEFQLQDGGQIIPESSTANPSPDTLTIDFQLATGTYVGQLASEVINGCTNLLLSKQH
ncbi:hypothetical protein [Castellaniella sp.]|uniref:hypothetical protein n=1 Tax=Castellaniella sp. TaxID=1955812 RepID=UPI002AFF0EC8|nr:hypothetical protein [Castellaniella sp.]